MNSAQRMAVEHLAGACEQLSNLIQATACRLETQGIDPNMAMDQHGMPVMAPMLTAYVNGLTALAQAAGS